MAGPHRQGGRPRDRGIDRMVLEVARRHLAGRGLAALSVAAVADEARTSRTAVYRRWATRRDLAEAAILTLEVEPAAPASGRPWVDLVTECHQLHAFARASGATALAGVMLTDDADPSLRELFREHLVMPRRRRVLGYLRAGVDAGVLAPTADIELAHTLPSGSWLAHALAGGDLPENWAKRTAALVWRSCGGDVMSADNELSPVGASESVHRS
jgi:AcrR family transcriptional regulator